MADGFFRGKSGFTVVQNGIVRDKNVSMKAKGLYLIIQSYITMPDKKWRKTEFQKMVKEGEKAFESAWNELKSAGYLKIHMYSNGLTWSVEYDLLDEPEPGAHSFYYNGKGEMVRTNLDAAQNVDNFRTPQNGGNGSRTPHFGTNGNGTYGNGTSGDGRDGNGGNNNKDSLSNTDCKALCVTPSLNHSGSEGQTDRKELSTVTMLDPQYRLRNGSIRIITEELKSYNGIPYEWSTDVETMIEAIQVLSEWNEYMDLMEGKDWMVSVYKLTIEALVEMATAEGICEYNGAHVSYAKVIDQINVIYRNYREEEETSSFRFFVDRIVVRFIEIQKETRIMNQKNYLKSLIWTSFSTYKTDWESFFHRNYYLGQRR